MTKSWSSHRRSRLLFGLVGLAVLVGACGLTDPAFDADGVVRFVDVEGGCWGIDSAGQRLEPINLPERFRVDGLRVSFQAEDAADVASICQIGRLVRLTEIDTIAP
ncbi:MAG: hypothetical protein OEO79_17025 [Gemmatimonadota bacterium]|nr:hypothetical protein [Gemmatimonadota bacterium]